MVKGPRRISFTVTEQQFHDLHDLAYRTRGSISQLGQIAILQLLIDVETGKIPSRVSAGARARQRVAITAPIFSS
jgi:hypothetical protein